MLRPLAQELGRLQHGCRCRHDQAIDHFICFIQPLRLDDTLQEYIAYRFPRGHNIQHIELRHDIFRMFHIGHAFRKYPDHLWCHGFIASHDDRNILAHRCQHPGIVQNSLFVAAVRTARQQYDICLEGANLINLIFIEFAAVHTEHLRTGTECRTLGSLRRQFRHEPDGNHLESASCTGAAQHLAEFQLTRFSEHFLKPLMQAIRDIRLYGCNAPGRSQDLFLIDIHRSNFGIGAAKINQQYVVHIIYLFLPNQPSNHR